MEPGRIFSTANGRETNRANATAVAMPRGKTSTKQMMNSAAANTTQPTIMGIFFPDCLDHLLTAG